jgi:transposase
MSDLYWLTDEQMARLAPFFPRSRGRPQVDDRRVLSGIIFANRNGLRWRDAPSDYGPPKTLYNRWKRWGAMGVFAPMMEGLAAEADAPKTVMIDATYLKAHRTASTWAPKRGASGAEGAPHRPHERWPQHEAPRRHRRRRTAHPLLPERRPGQRLHGGARLAWELAQGGLAAGRSRL